MLGDRLAEGGALLGVLRGELERTDRDTARAGRDVDPPDLDAVHHLEEAAAGNTTENVARGCLVVVEDQLGRIDALVAHLVDLAGDGEAGYDLAESGGLLDQEGRQVLVRLLRAFLRLDQRGDQRGAAPPLVSHIFWPLMT